MEILKSLSAQTFLTCKAVTFPAYWSCFFYIIISLPCTLEAAKRFFLIFADRHILNGASKITPQGPLSLSRLSLSLSQSNTHVSSNFFINRKSAAVSITANSCHKFRIKQLDFLKDLQKFFPINRENNLSLSQLYSEAIIAKPEN